MFYVFVRKSNIYDTLYFIAICSIMISWFFTGIECIISFWEKICLDHTYEYGTNRSLPFIHYIFPETITGGILISITIFTTYNLYIMMSLYKVPWPIMITILVTYLNPILGGIKEKLNIK